MIGNQQVLQIEELHLPATHILLSAITTLYYYTMIRKTVSSNLAAAVTPEQESSGMQCGSFCLDTLHTATDDYNVAQ